MRYNATSSLFSSYATTTSTAPVKVYRLKGAPDTSLRFKVSNDSGTLDNVDVSYGGQEISVYVFGNVDWTASINGGASLDKTSGNGPAILTVNVPENTGSSVKSYTVTVSTTAAVPTKSYSLTLTQPVAPSGTPELVYSFVLSKEDSNLGSNGSYAGNCDINVNGITWNVTGVSNSTTYDGWRLGGKALDNVDRVFYSKTAIPADVTKVIVTHAAMNITVNSFTMTVYRSAADAAGGTNAIATVKGTASATSPTTFEKPDASSWAGCYYRFTYNVTNTGSSNKYVQMKAVEVWGYPDN